MALPRSKPHKNMRPSR